MHQPINFDIAFKDGRVLVPQRIQQTVDSHVSGVRILSPYAAFELAEQLCYAAAKAMNIPTDDPALREEQQERPRRGWFTELYLTITNMAHDHHRETVRRKNGEESGQFTEALLDPMEAFTRTGERVLEVVQDWDY